MKTIAHQHFENQCVRLSRDTRYIMCTFFNVDFVLDETSVGSAPEFYSCHFSDCAADEPASIVLPQFDRS